MQTTWIATARRNGRSRALVGAGLAGLLVLTACSGGSGDGGAAATGASANQAEETVVRVASNGVTSDIGLFLADEYGYFDAMGIKMEYTEIQSAGDIIPLVASGQIEVYASAFAAGFVNAVLGGVDMRVVADKGRLTDGSTPSYGMMLVRAELADQIAGPEDFKGRAVAWGDPATGSTKMLEEYLAPAGLTVDDVRLVTLSMPERIVALQTGAVEIANVFEPTGTQALADGGYAKILFDLAEVAPNQQQAVLALAGEWADSNEDAARRFVSAYVCGVQDYMNAVHAKEGLSAIWAILEKRRGAYPPGLLDKAIPPTIDYEGRPNTEDIEKQIEWFAHNGYAEGTVPVDKVVDTSYIENRTPCQEMRG